MNGCLVDANAGAVTEYGRERNRATQDQETARGTARLRFFAHELRNLTHTALLAYEVLKTGDVGIGGSTGRVLGRALAGLQVLIEHSLDEVRLTRGIQHRQVFAVCEFIAEIGSAATLEGNARNIRLIIAPPENVSIDADRRVLAAAVTNLLQNAFKFTRPGTSVTLRVRASDESVFIEIEDECGGLPVGDVEELFRRPYIQLGGDRSGLGIGLAYSRWGVEANYGRLSARSLPGRGCIFTIDLPRVADPDSLINAAQTPSQARGILVAEDGP